LMVVARKRRKQTNQRMLDFSGIEVMNPDSGRLEAFVDINQSSGGNAGLTIAGWGPLRPLEWKRMHRR